MRKHFPRSSCLRLMKFSEAGPRHKKHILTMAGSSTKFHKEAIKMTTFSNPPQVDQTTTPVSKRSIADFLKPLNELAASSASLLERHFGEVSNGTESWQIPRFLHI